MAERYTLDHKLELLTGLPDEARVLSSTTCVRRARRASEKQPF
jgi:hypothetical protein